MLYKGKISLIKIKYLYRCKSPNFTKENNNNNLDTNLINNKHIHINHVNKKAKNRKKRIEKNCLEKYKYNLISMKNSNNNKYEDKFQVIFNNNYSKKA